MSCINAGAPRAFRVQPARPAGALPAQRPGLALRWDGTAWTQAPSIQLGGPDSGDFLNGVSAISASEAWAVGFFGPTPTQTLAFHFK